jgi:hypothetical protein
MQYPATLQKDLGDMVGADEGLSEWISPVAVED